MPRASRSWVRAATISQLQRSACSGVRSAGVVQPRVFFANLNMLLSAGLFDNALASLGEDGSAALSEDVRRRRPVGMVTADRRRDDARLFSCV